MRVHHITAPTLCPLSATLVNGAGGLFRRGRMVCHCLVIESDDGLILVDTGLGTADVADPKKRLGTWFNTIMGPPRDPAETVVGELARLGLRREDVRHIVPTHLDLDHAGGLSDFPEATVHIFAPEHAAAMAPASAMERARYRAVQWSHGPRWLLHDRAGETWFGFDGVRALSGAAEVLLIPLEGHTRGHCGVAVRQGAGWLLHAGDAYFHHREMDPEHPTCTRGLAIFQRIAAVDDTQRRQNQVRLRELGRDHKEVQIHSAHCPVEFDRFAEAAQVESASGMPVKTTPAPGLL
ncbi:MAG: MBL fold metallo-hydrolase [Myxococcales bacterium]|nr:MBL fold metallo-hydrolase [Myxococcales bacterium]